MTQISTRAALRARLFDTSQPAVLVPLCLDPLTARLCEELGFDAGYISGGALGYQLAVSEALLTIGELAGVCASISRRSALPIVIDGGVGFGDPVHATRMMWDFEAAGAAAVEIEDQVVPKRVSHHRGVEHLVTVEEMVAKIHFAAKARRDSDFLIIARTGAVKHESFAAGIDRANTYLDAGADLAMVFPSTAQEWEDAPGRVRGPLVAMTSLSGRSAIDWAAQGWRMVIDPFTGQVVAVDAVRAAYSAQLNGDGPKASNLMESYATLPGLAGLEALYDIERATTEPGT